MASQQVLFAETIAGMKKAFKRKSYESDSDSDIESYGNRGHKLKRRARFSHKGQLVPAEGPSAYKETVDYAGVRRSIIHRNPPLFDEDGYEVDSEDDQGRIEEAIASAAEMNPYANIRLEHVLAPLTASTDLPTHPTLSVPFTSPNLPNLVQQSSAMMRRENGSLWRVRHMWTALCGDHIWAPCESMIGPRDEELYTEDHVARHLLSLSKALTNGAGQNDEEHNNAQEASDQIANENADADQTMTDAGADDEPKVNSGKDAEPQPEAQDPEHAKGETTDKTATDQQAAKEGGLANGELDSTTEANDDKEPKKEDAGNEGQTAAAAGNSAASVVSDTEQPFIHPMFLPPAGARPDRNLGLPEAEAEDVRRLLTLYIQKQEEVCRGVTRLHDGLTKAQRLRQDVLHWSKAEAHSGVNRDLSDGEDWYDKEEWGLTEDLKKGQDDEEEDTTTTGKKTRARR